MKPEMLDPLLLDRTLGELSPEVAALLDAHLAQNPEAARRAVELADTLQLARAATVTPTGSPPRPLDRERLLRAQRRQLFPRRRSEVFRLAACLALGLGLGWLARTPSPRTIVAAAAPRPLPIISVPTTRPIAAQTERFWSVARLVAEERAQSATESHGDNRFELHWNSSAKQPRMEGKL
jgi:anti-sigma factor RsiW